MNTTSNKPVKTAKVEAYEVLMNQYNEAVRSLNTSTIMRGSINIFDTEAEQAESFENAIEYAERRIAQAKAVMEMAEFLRNSPETANEYKQYMSDLYNFRHAQAFDN